MDRIRNFGYLLKDVTRLYTRHFEQRTAELGLTLPQCKVMVYLQRHEGSTQARLAELTETDPMTLVRIIDRMEQDGLIERRADANDRRAHRLHLKPAAEAALAEIWRIGDGARAEVLAGLSPADHNQLMTLLEHLHANLLALVPSTNDGGKASSTVTNRRLEPSRSRNEASLSGTKRGKGTV